MVYRRRYKFIFMIVYSFSKNFYKMITNYISRCKTIYFCLTFISNNSITICSFFKNSILNFII
nr:MAG TPA: hypothetical protein [Caudoviricetes sp.]